MLTMTATEVSRNFNRVLDLLESGVNEILITRNNYPVARLISVPKNINTKELMESIAGSITEEEGEQ